MPEPPVPKQRTPVETMALAATGDRDAFAAIYRSYELVVLRYVQLRVGNVHVAEDIAARTWIRALASVHRWIDQGRDPGAWLVTIARNLVLDYLKSKQYKLEVPTGGDALDQDPSPHDGPEADMLTSERAAQVRHAISRLSPDQRRCMTLSLRGLSLGEIAREMGREYTAVKALSFRAQRRLRELLTKDSGEPTPARITTTREGHA